MSTTFISSSSNSFSFRSAVLCKIFTDELSPMKCAMKSYKGQYFGSPVVSLIMADRYTGDDLLRHAFVQMDVFVSFV